VRQGRWALEVLFGRHDVLLATQHLSLSVKGLDGTLGPAVAQIANRDGNEDRHPQ
jgi:hypothetical protein